MVDQTNIFEGSDQNPDQSGDQTQAFQVPETVSDLVGEGKKYSDVNKALESIPHAQEHISRLEEELAAARAKIEATTSIEETLKSFQSQKEQDTPTSQPIDPNEIDSLIEQKLTQKEVARVQSANMDSVASKLVEQFGDKDKAEEAFDNKAKELGVDVSYLNNLAATSPKAVFQLFGTNVKAQSSTATTSSVNTEVFNSTSNKSKPIPQVLSGGSTQDLMGAWNAAKESVTGE